MQAIGRQPQRAPDGAPVHYDRHRPDQTTLYRLVQQHAAILFAQTEDAAGADLPQFVKDEFDAFLECGILAHGSLRLRCGDCMPGASIAGGAGRGAAQPATMPIISSPHAAAKAVRDEATHPMTLLLLESLLALVLALLIVWWVALAGRDPNKRDDRDP